MSLSELSDNGRLSSTSDSFRSLLTQAVEYLPHVLTHAMRTCSVTSWQLLEQYLLKVTARIHIDAMPDALTSELADHMGCLTNLQKIVSRCLAVMFQNSEEISSQLEALFSASPGECVARLFPTITCKAHQSFTVVETLYLYYHQCIIIAHRAHYDIFATYRSADGQVPATGHALVARVSAVSSRHALFTWQCHRTVHGRCEHRSQRRLQQR